MDVMFKHGIKDLLSSHSSNVCYLAWPSSDWVHASMINYAPQKTVIRMVM